MKGYLAAAGLAVAGVLALVWYEKAKPQPPAQSGDTPAPQGATNRAIQLVPGQTVIWRANVGDTATILAPSGWGVPSANANIPGFLEIQSTSTVVESTTVKVTDGGQGQVSMSNSGETAILSIDASAASAVS
jgi:hypothetical protein